MQRSVLIFCSILVSTSGGTSLYHRLNITTPKSPYSEGESAIHWGRTSRVVVKAICCPNAIFEVASNSCVVCVVCQSGFEGIPPRCRPGPELWDVCYEGNPCGPNSGCTILLGNRSCACLPTFTGSPPNCQPAPVWETCRNMSCGRDAGCELNLFPSCYCHPGFVGNPPNCRPGTELLSRCNPYPCGPHSDCHMQDGHPVCSCRPGFVGAPTNCTPDPVVWRVCFMDRPCGYDSECRMEDKAAVCSPCPLGYLGEPPYCWPEDNRTPQSPYSEGESALGQAPTPCLCGPNTVCVYKNGTRECVCEEGYEGSPPRCRPSP